MRGGKGLVLFFISISLFLIVVSLFFVTAQSVSDTMKIEVNVLSSSGSQQPEVGIEVPDYIFLGNISKGELVSTNVTINNTGKVKINVKPELVDPNDNIFQNLYFKESSSSYKKIGDFNMNITASEKKLYIKLDLSDYDGDITQDMIGHKADVRFVAVAA